MNIPAEDFRSIARILAAGYRRLRDRRRRESPLASPPTSSPHGHEVIHWALRREELCDPGLCPDAPDDGGRCDHCPLDRLDAAQSSEPGQLIRRALDLRAAMKLGVTVCLDEVAGDEFYAMLFIEEEWDRLERERLPGQNIG